MSHSVVRGWVTVTQFCGPDRGPGVDRTKVRIEIRRGEGQPPDVLVLHASTAVDLSAALAELPIQDRSAVSLTGEG
jgi:hypothetical protein